MKEEFAQADPGRVKVVLDYLLECFNRFCDEHPEIEVIDQFMGVHNFHVVFILSMERDLRLSPNLQLFTRDLALETFRQALENKPAFKQGEK